MIGYYESILPHMRTNGLILFDNMLWRGRLAANAPSGIPTAAPSIA